MFTMLNLLLTLALSSTTLLTSVSAHGYVQEIKVDGTTYMGYLPYQDPYTSPAPERVVRPIPGNGELIVGYSPKCIFESEILYVSFLELTVGPVTDLTLIECVKPGSNRYWYLS